MEIIKQQWTIQSILDFWAINMRLSVWAFAIETLYSTAYTSIGTEKTSNTTLNTNNGKQINKVWIHEVMHRFIFLWNNIVLMHHRHHLIAITLNMNSMVLIWKKREYSRKYTWYISPYFYSNNYHIVCLTWTRK